MNPNGQIVEQAKVHVEEVHRATFLPMVYLLVFYTNLQIHQIVAHAITKHIRSLDPFTQISTPTKASYVLANFMIRPIIA